MGRSQKNSPRRRKPRGKVRKNATNSQPLSVTAVPAPDALDPSEERDPSTHNRLAPNQWAEILGEYGSGLGHADIAILGGDPTRTRATSFVLLGLSMTSPRFDSVVVISPPTHDAVGIATRVRAILKANRHPEQIADRFVHRAMSTVDSAAAVAAARECNDQTLIYVEAAGQFRHADIRVDRPSLSSESEWAPHVVRLATELSQAVQGSSSYVLLDVGHSPPVRPETRRLIAGAPDAVFSASVEDTAAAVTNAVIDTHSEEPEALARAIDAIAAAKHLDKKAASMLQAAALHGAGRYSGAWNVLSQVWDEWIETHDNATLVQLARIAADSDNPQYAQRALTAFAMDEAPVGLLEMALYAAGRSDNSEVESLIIERLRSVHSQSDVLAHHLVNRAMRTHDWPALQEIAQLVELNIEPREREYLHALASALGAVHDELDDVATALADRFPEHANSVRLLLGREATRHGRYGDALEQFVRVPLEGEDAVRAARMVLSTLEAVLLLRDGTNAFVIPGVLLAQFLAFAAARAARVPRDARLRYRVAEVLSVQVLGTRGEALLVYLIEHLGAEPLPATPTGTESASLEEVRRFLRLVEQWALEAKESGKPLIIGAGLLPAEITTTDATRLLSILPDALLYALRDTEEPASVQTVQLVLHGILLVCDRARERRVGLMLLRRAAIHLASHGRAQNARDMAEHALSLVGDDPVERRIAWATFADIYHRLGDLHEALIGLLFAFSVDGVALRAEEAWQERFLLVRLLRDLGLLDEAEEILRHAGTALTPTASKDARFESIRLSIRMRRIDASATSVSEQLNFVGALEKNIRALIALDADEDLTPPLVILMQLVARMQRDGATMSDDTLHLINDALQKVPPSALSRLSALGSMQPTLATARTLTTHIGSTRSADDLGYDIQPAAVVAQRALLDVDGMDTMEVAELIELLTDKTLVEPTENGASATERGLRHLCEHGLVAHLLGLNERGELVRATFQRDVASLSLREDDETFAPQAFREWARQYPYKYSTMDTPDSVMGDLVRRSVDAIGISSSVGPAVIVADTRLQRFPMNLLRYDNDFLGDLHPIATAPSLAWLANTAARPYQSNGRRIAWISDAQPDGDESPALGPLADRLEPIMAQYSVSFIRSPDIPEQLLGSDLAIVTAHGGLLPGDRFFQVVRDDATERWSPRSIARALMNSGIVVLFVCSGGRFDEHPRARTTVGMSRLLLEHGVRAVVASPWPIDTRVPPHWLPKFLEQLETGVSVMLANHAANKAVSNAFGGNPPHTYAMHVYGDPTQQLEHGAPESRGEI
jgi:tetratricopeptide (TPR) repeat protein